MGRPLGKANGVPDMAVWSISNLQYYSIFKYFFDSMCNINNIIIWR